MKNNKIEKKMEDPIYKSKVFFLMGQNEEEFIEWTRKNKIKFPHDITRDDGGTTDVNEGQFYILWVKDIKNIPTLVHESIHLASYILHRKGININQDTEEALTYLASFWFKRFYNLIKN